MAVLHQDLQLFAHQTPVELPPLLLPEVPEELGPLLLLTMSHRLRHLPGFGAGPRGEGEDVEVGDGKFL